MAESFFLQALDEARRTAARELRVASESLETDLRTVDARTEVLALREKDWTALLAQQREELDRSREQIKALLAVNARLDAARE